jgi:glycosyltransferase involved in cell wall biosynthesis
MTHGPLVSVCIPTFNRAGVIGDALESALSQTYRSLEIVVVDDASTDDTADRIEAHQDKRICFYRNVCTLGQAGNRNRTLALSRGSLIKFLDSDDQLEPDCISRMVELFMDQPSVGFVFSRRNVLLDEPVTGASIQWKAQYEELHTNFSTLELLNDGRQLLKQWLAAGLHDNWIGEPSVVMVRRSHLERVGGFAVNVRQTIDTNLWARLLPYTNVGFVDAALATYRYWKQSEHAVNSRTRESWLDRLWTFEDLVADPCVRGMYPEVLTLLTAERRQAWRTAIRLGRLGHNASVPVRPYLPYLRFRVQSLCGSRPPTFPPLEGVG